MSKISWCVTEKGTGHMERIYYLYPALSLVEAVSMVFTEEG